MEMSRVSEVTTDHQMEPWLSQVIMVSFVSRTTDWLGRAPIAAKIEILKK